ncbi:MAG TPA: hypothetical protein GXX72_09050 [Clostridiaceae bacterium]|nr:hypothetical protein [Clostridiaceae bacterium]
MVRIALDAGHGINTAGKRVPSYMGVGNISEWELNNRVTIEQIKLLEQYENVQILRLDDPTGKRDVPLIERTNKANKWNADILISNHHNAGVGGGSGGGLVLYRYPNSNKFTKSMQKSLYDAMIKAGAIKGNRANPLATKNLHMVRESTMAAILIEYAFMDSTTDIKEILKDDFHKKMAEGVVNWIVEHYGLKKKSQPDAKPTPKPTTKPKPQAKLSSKGNSIVDYLNSVGIDSSFKNRKKLAEKHGIRNYKGTAEQNLKLLALLRNDKLVNKPKPESKPSSEQKSAYELAKEVIAGKWGNGAERKRRLERAGYNFNKVQAEVNRILGSKPASKPATKTFKVGTKVRLKTTATKYATGQTIPARYKGKIYTVQQIKTDRVLLKELYSWVYKKDVE